MGENMKKALVVANLAGFVHFLWNDIEILQEMGYEIVFAAHDEMLDNKARYRYFEQKGITFFNLSLSSKNPFSKKNLNAFFELQRLMRQEDFDLIHCHTPIAGFVARAAAQKYRRGGTKVIYTSHGLAFTRFSTKKQWWTYYLLEKLASLFTDTIITINQEDYLAAKKFFCKDIRKINGVGVDTKLYHNVDINTNAYKEKLGLPQDKIMVLSVGELSVRKNHQIIIKALGEIKEKDKYIYVICGREVGNGSITNSLKALAKECGVELYLLGHRNDIPEIMHCSDIGAIPSVREGLGLAGVQSLCAEVPLVGTDVQGIREYIIDGVTGYLCLPYDVKGYAEAITKLSDPALRISLKRNCYDVAKQFDVTVSHCQMRNIYTSLLGEKTQ